MNVSIIINNLSIPFRTYKINSYSTLWRIVKNKMNNYSGEVNMLQKRLSTAETQLRKLTTEINSIKSAMKKLVNERDLIESCVKEFEAVDGDSVDSEGTEQSPKRFKLDPEDSNFSYNSDYVVVYTDGACENNGKKGARAGIGIWFGPNHPLNVSAPVNGRATNNTAEIQACSKAIDIALKNGVEKLCIRTDSQFVINAMTKWIHKWKKNNWKLAGGGDVKNKEEFVKLDAYCRKIKSLKWEHVAGHKGIIGNEAADKLARDGAMFYVEKKF